MPFTLKEVAPWGRSYEEYLRFFSLSGDDLKKRVLGCADGPASFNALLTARGGRVVSVDPLYLFSAEEIRGRIDETVGGIMDGLHDNMDSFVWTDIPSVEALGERRLEAMELFVKDYSRGLSEGRYVNANLPSLPFKSAAFDLALSSHLLFLYSGHFSEEFHVDSIKELCRVASEVRIFPLLSLDSETSKHLAPVTERLRRDGFSLDITRVDYEFQRGGNRMLTVKGPYSENQPLR